MKYILDQEELNSFKERFDPVPVKNAFEYARLRILQGDGFPCIHNAINPSTYCDNCPCSTSIDNPKLTYSQSILICPLTRRYSK